MDSRTLNPANEPTDGESTPQLDVYALVQVLTRRVDDLEAWLTELCDDMQADVEMAS